MITASLTKVDNNVTLKLSTPAGDAAIVLDDSKTVYSALHDARESIEEKLGILLDSLVDNALEPEKLPLRRAKPEGTSPTFAIVDPDFGKLDVLLPGGAATILDGQQVASPVAQPDAVPDTVPDGAPPKSKKGKSVPPPKDAA